MKDIDIKSLIIGALLTSTLLLGVAAVKSPNSGSINLDRPIEVRLGFGASTTDSSTPTALGNALGNLEITFLNGKLGPANFDQKFEFGK